MKQWFLDFTEGLAFVMLMMGAIVLVVLILFIMLWPMTGLMFVLMYEIPMIFYFIMYIPWILFVIWIDN